MTKTYDITDTPKGAAVILTDQRDHGQPVLLIGDEAERYTGGDEDSYSVDDLRNQARGGDEPSLSDDDPRKPARSERALMTTLYECAIRKDYQTLLAFLELARAESPGPIFERNGTCELSVAERVIDGARWTSRVSLNYPKILAMAFDNAHPDLRGFDRPLTTVQKTVLRGFVDLMAELQSNPRDPETRMYMARPLAVLVEELAATVQSSADMAEVVASLDRVTDRASFTRQTRTNAVSRAVRAGNTAGAFGIIKAAIPEERPALLADGRAHV